MWILVSGITEMDSRVWPGALLVQGEIAGTWRRAEGTVTVQP